MSTHLPGMPSKPPAAACKGDPHPLQPQLPDLTEMIYPYSCTLRLAYDESSSNTSARSSDSSAHDLHVKASATWSTTLNSHRSYASIPYHKSSAGL